MINASYNIVVRFLPVKYRPDEFCNKILDIASNVTLNGGSYSKYPSVEWFTQDKEMAEHVEREIKYTIEEYGGRVIIDNPFRTEDEDIRL